MLNREMLEQIEIMLEKCFGKSVKTGRTSGIGGGCINDAHRVDTSEGSFFVKYNNARRYPGMFSAEARGLELLRKSDTVYVPEVIGHGETGADSFIVLEYISAEQERPDFWEHFGRELAKMHRQQPTLETEDDGAAKEKGGREKDMNSQNKQMTEGNARIHQDQAGPMFGLDHDNYIGSLPQSNARHPDWIEFFIMERLEAQLKLARDEGRAGQDLSRMFQKFYRHLPDFFPDEPPALLHGDLWSGNYMRGNDGQAVIIDPAVYYGHRYMDLGMSKLFGGFLAAFYDAYHDAYPLEASWQQGIDIANLYPLMVHVNLFGGGYLNSVKATLRRFS